MRARAGPGGFAPSAPAQYNDDVAKPLGRILVVDEDYEGIVAVDPVDGARVELSR